MEDSVLDNKSQNIVSVPSISRNSPLKIEEVEEKYEESKIEKRGKLIFYLGSIFAFFELVAVWVIFIIWVKNFS